MDPHIHEKAADLIEPVRVLVNAALKDLIFNLPQFLLRIDQKMQVLLDQHFQKVIDKPLERRRLAVLLLADLLNGNSRVLAVFDEDNALFIQSKGELVGFSAHLRPARHMKSARKGVHVDDSLGLEHFQRIHFYINDHVELFLGPVPGLGIHDDDVRRVPGFGIKHLIRAARRQFFFDLIIHILSPARLQLVQAVINF